MLNSRYYLQVLSLVYTILIAIAFFTKKTKKNTGSSIYSQLLINVFLCIVADICCVYTEGLDNKIYNYYFGLIFLLFIAKFILTFTEYITLIVGDFNTEEEKSKAFDKIHFISTLLYIIWAIFLIYIYVYYSQIDREVGNIIIYIYCGFSWALCIAYWIRIMSRYLIREIGEEMNFFKIIWILLMSFFKRLYTIAIAIIPGTIGLLIQLFIPNLHVIVPTFTFAAISMYFTIFPIENPDVKLAEEIEKSKAAADQANKSKTEFLSNISHEIRTPLNAILGFSHTLIQEDISDQTKEEVDYIISSSETLLEIVNEILDISKIESSKLEIINVDYSIEKLYKSLVTMTQEKIGSSQLQFIHNFSNELPPVLLGDYVRIKQVIFNILSNAIKYTESGFIKLKFSCDNITDDECRLVISVTDSGIGIDEDSLDSIFSKFKGLEIQEDVHIEGTGLGLSLTKRLVNMMNGKIVVQSVKGEGSTFIVYVTQKISNKKISELEEDNIAEISNEFVGNGQFILLVDDNPMNIKVALRLMQNYDLQIETLTSGKDCIAKIQAGKKYDLVMLDDMMPEMSGVDVLKVLKQNPDYKMTTIALTANAMSEMKKKYIADGFNDYLSKPIDKKKLNDLLIKYLGNKNKKEKVDKNIEEKKIDNLPEKNTLEEKHNKDYLIQNGVDIDKALEFLGDMEMYDETVNDFLAEVDEKLASIEKFRNDNDMPNYAIQVHSLKSDAKYLGLMDLADIAYKHEMASKGNDINFVNENYNELMNIAKSKVELIKKYNE